MHKRNVSYGSAVEWLSGPGAMSWRRAFPGRPDQVVVARKFALSMLTGSGCEEEAEFVVAELGSNAVRHTRSGEHGGWFGLEIAITDLVYVAVTDLGGGQVPTVRHAQAGLDQEEGGRGLLGVSRLAVALGIHGSPVFGHTIWADLDMSFGCEAKPRETLLTL